MRKDHEYSCIAESLYLEVVRLVDAGEYRQKEEGEEHARRADKEESSSPDLLHQHTPTNKG